jgi:hypothetical protein
VNDISQAALYLPLSLAILGYECLFRYTVFVELHHTINHKRLHVIRPTAIRCQLFGHLI